jgi:UDP-N-acetylglucosamine--N-acetylmuramyl-(pentapeptide) pyrophosphoryl-undecaprenol N-acetylglucosamine transferase
MSKKILLLAGRTGGPIMPLIAIANRLENYEYIILGINGGMETQLAQNLGLKIEYLPEIKFRLGSFSAFTLKEFLQVMWKSLLDLIKIPISIWICFNLIIKYRPIAIFSAGSFLAPIIIPISRLLSKLKFTKKAFIFVHQQDPKPGIANKLTYFFADLLTCSFEYTKNNYKQFKYAKLIPNPIDTDKFDDSNLSDLKTPMGKLVQGFYQLKPAELPFMFIFGGGSGSKEINQWVWSNLDNLNKKYYILHLTGNLTSTNNRLLKRHNYLGIPSLTSEMTSVLKKSEVVICRAGLSSISELLYLAKPAFLIPLKNSHQELNAKLVQENFFILQPDEREEWLDLVLQAYPTFFLDLEYPRNNIYKEKLTNFYNSLELRLSAFQKH